MIPERIPTDPWRADEDASPLPANWRDLDDADVRRDHTLGRDGECPTNCWRCGGEGCRMPRPAY